MGVYSWKTADTQQSIRVYSSAYLLQPDGQAPLFEETYEGYGMFGGVDAHVWLAQNNLPAEKVAEMSWEDLRCAGIALAVGKVCRDTEAGEFWWIYNDHREILDCRYFPGRWDDVNPAWGMSPNSALESGRLTEMPVSEVFSVKRPLKFSFSPDAIYEQLGPSDVCEKQGWF